MNHQILRQLKPLLRRRGLSHGAALGRISQAACQHTENRRLRPATATFTSTSGIDGKESHRLFEEQIRELQEERESLFGFTEADHSAWTNAGGSGHRHEPSFLEEIDSARSALERGEAAPAASASNDDEDVDLPTTAAHDPAGPLLLSTPSSSFSHVTPDGSSIRMVDVGSKAVSHRTAVAQSRVVFPPEVVQAFQIQGSDLIGSKGPIFATAKIAGIMAAKRTSELIPLCHPLPLDAVNVDIRLHGDSVAVIHCECRTHHTTGVEMEALTGASIAALTIYDMTKAVSHKIRIEDTILLSKSGGKRNV